VLTANEETFVDAHTLPNALEPRQAVGPIGRGAKNKRERSHSALHIDHVLLGRLGLVGGE